ncbi:MAG: hypothetical protein V3W11_10335 [bacterium]
MISSFKVADNWFSYADAVSRDGTYVYYITHDRATPVFYLDYRYPGGGGGGAVFIGGFPADHGDADRSVLGFGYIADVYRRGSGPQTITDFDIRTGSAVASWAPLSSMQGYAYNPARRIRYVGSNNYVYRYNMRGSLLSSFGAPIGISGLAAPLEFAGKPGEYIIVTRGTYWYAFTGQGVEVARVLFPWAASRISNSACGPGYPPAYGNTLWCLANVEMKYDYVCQIYLGNATAVAPASVGRIKALFR